MSLIGTKNINSASTEEKIRTIARAKPSMAKYLNNTFQSNVSFNEAYSNPNNQTSLDRYTRNTIVTLFSVELQAETAIASTLTPVSDGISSVGKEAVHQIQGVKENLNKLLQPVSSVTGSTLGNMTNVLKDPLGAPGAIGNSMINLIDKVNPDFANSLDATFKKYKADEMANLPGQAIGSIRNLAALADSILSVPFAMAADLYNGLLEIMQEVSDLVDSLISSVFDLFFGPEGVVDSIIPIAMIQEFLDTLGEVTSFVGGVTQMAGGFVPVANITSQVSLYTSQANGILNNPAQLALQYVPPEAGQALNALRNPEGVIQSLLPTSVLDQIKQIQNVPGLGFVGNMGYGLKGTLETLSEGVFTKMTDKFTDQLSIISPNINKSNKTQGAYNNQLDHPPAIQGASTNPNISTVQGVPVQTSPRSPILASKESGTTPSQPNNSSPNTPNTIHLGAKTQ